MDDEPVTTHTASHSDAASDDGPISAPADTGRGDGLDRLRAAPACGLVPDEQVGPLFDLLDALSGAVGAEDRAARIHPGSEPLDVACRNGYVAASLMAALRVYETLAGSS